MFILQVPPKARESSIIVAHCDVAPEDVKLCIHNIHCKSPSQSVCTSWQRSNRTQSCGTTPDGTLNPDFKLCYPAACVKPIGGKVQLRFIWDDLFWDTLQIDTRYTGLLEINQCVVAELQLELCGHRMITGEQL